MKLFIDVDNTILEHTTFYNSRTEGRLHKIFGLDPESNEPAIMRMYESSVCSDVENLKKIFDLDNVYILTKTANQIYEQYKRERLAKLFNITVDELLALKDSSGHPKYITVDLNIKKSTHLMELFNLDTIHDCILVDDYSNNIIEWEDDGGIGVKFNNQYNTVFHPKGGIVISNFKLFSFLVNDDKLKNIIVEPKIAGYFNLNNEENNVVNYLNFVKSFVLEKFGVNKNITENTRNDFTNFLNQCYTFIQENNFDLLKEYMKNKSCDERLNIIINPFEYTNKFHKIVENDDVLSIAYSKNEDEVRFRDIYISVPTELYYENTHQTIERSLKVIEQFTNIR